MTPIRCLTGPLWEIEFFGCTADQFGPPANLDWPTALSVATSHQAQSARNWDPYNPRLPASIRLFNAVCAALRPENKVRCVLYCTVGTPLDQWHLADGAFMLSDEPITVIVTIDLTIDPHKDMPDRSNRIIVRPEDIDDPVRLRTLATSIAKELERRQGMLRDHRPGHHAADRPRRDHKKEKRKKKKARRLDKQRQDET